MFDGKDPEFDPQKILAKSAAASGLCSWVINIHNFYNVYLVVQPKQKALSDAQVELREARDKMNFLNNKIQVGWPNESETCSRHGSVMFEEHLIRYWSVTRLPLL